MQNKNIILFTIVIVLILMVFGLLFTFIVFDTKPNSNNFQGEKVEIENSFKEVNITINPESHSEDSSVNIENFSENISNNIQENSSETFCDINNTIKCSADKSDSNSEINSNEEQKNNPTDENNEEEVKENLAYNFKTLNLEGDKVKLSDYRGKPVIIEFWNSWCHNCQREMPKLQKTYEKYEGAFEIIGINLLANNDSEEKVQAFVKKYKITFPIVYDDDLFVAWKYNIKATNTHFLINKDGTIYDSFFVDLEEEKLKEFLKFNGIEK